VSRGSSTTTPLLGSVDVRHASARKGVGFLQCSFRGRNFLRCSQQNIEKSLDINNTNPKFCVKTQFSEDDPISSAEMSDLRLPTAERPLSSFCRRIVVKQGILQFHHSTIHAVNSSKERTWVPSSAEVLTQGFYTA
jgi:hypothetical protein